MLKNILSLKKTQKLSKKQQRRIIGGTDGVSIAQTLEDEIDDDDRICRGSNCKD